MQEALEKYYKLVKENLSGILVVPTERGRLWQILELSIISPSLIRLFSRINASVQSNSTEIGYFNSQSMFLTSFSSRPTEEIEVLKFDAFFEKENASNRKAQTKKSEINSLKNIFQSKTEMIDSLNSKVSHLSSHINE